MEEEKRKFDELKKERLDLEEKLKLTVANLEEHKVKIEGQDKTLEELRAQIDTKKASVATLENSIKEETKVHTKEERDNRKLAKDNAALEAKLKFIREKYDFNSNVRNLKPDEFTELENTNTEVSAFFLFQTGHQNCEPVQAASDGRAEGILDPGEQPERLDLLRLI